MKNLIIILLTFISLASYGQYDSTVKLQPVSMYGSSVNGLKIRAFLIIPNDTPRLAIKDSGAIAYKGGFLWINNGHYWIKSGNSATVSGGKDSSAFHFVTQYNDSSFALHNLLGDSSVVIIRLAVTTVNEQNFTWEVEDSLNTPPVTPVTNGYYLVGDSPSGLWLTPTNHAKDIAHWGGSAYDYTDAVSGNTLMNLFTSITSQFNGSTWKWTGNTPFVIGGNSRPISPGYVFKLGTKSNNSLSWITNNLIRQTITGAGNWTVFNQAGNGTRLLTASPTGLIGNIAVPNSIKMYLNGYNQYASFNTDSIAQGTTNLYESTTATEGLTKTSNDIQLGGTITSNKTINTGAVTLTLNTSTAGGNPLKINNNTGSAIKVASSGGIGYDFTGTGTGFNVVVSNGSAGFMKSTNAAAVLDIQADNGTGNIVIPTITQSRVTSATAAAGIGISNTFSAEYDAGINDQTNAIISKWTNATGSSRLSQFSITGNDGGGIRRLMAFGGNGLITIDSLAGNKYLTADTIAHKPVVVDASGNLGRGYWAGGVSGGTGNGLANFYLKDSSLSNNRTVELNGSYMRFGQGGNDFLVLDPQVNAEFAKLQAFNITGGGNVANTTLITDDVSSNFINEANFDSDSKRAYISGFANATSSTLTYTADTHTINGKHARIETTDGTAASAFDISGDLSDYVGFVIRADDDTHPVIGIEGDAVSNTITHTATTHTFNGSIVYNTPVSGTSTDSVLTWDASTGAINMRSASEFGSSPETDPFSLHSSDTATSLSGYRTAINRNTDSANSMHAQIVGLSGTVASNTSAINGKINIADYIVRETPSGSKNGSNVTFTLANTPVTGKEMVFLNGLLQDSTDYSISGAIITYTVAPSTGDKLVVSYIK